MITRLCDLPCKCRWNLDATALGLWLIGKQVPVQLTPMKPVHRQLIGVDISAASVANAKANAAANGIDNAAFLCLDLSKPEHVQQLQAAAPAVDVAIAGVQLLALPCMCTCA